MSDRPSNVKALALTPDLIAEVLRLREENARFREALVQERNELFDLAGALSIERAENERLRQRMATTASLLEAAGMWLNGGKCCGQHDATGTCVAPACVWGEAVLKMRLEGAVLRKSVEEGATDE